MNFKTLKESNAYNTGFENGFAHAKHEFKALLAKQRKALKESVPDILVDKVIGVLEEELK